MNRITALVPTFNCQETLRDCLESVKWADEILVVDSYSTDNTLDIATAYTNRVIQHEYITSAKQKNWAMQFVDTEWVLQIDSDETVEAELAKEIIEILGQDNPADGYQIPRKNLIWGKWVKHCNYYPDYQLRFFRASAGRWSDRQVHAHVTGLNQLDTLQNHLIHDDLSDLSKELVQFGRQVLNWECQELLKRGKRWRWQDVTLRPTAIFLLYYFCYGGYREGFRGFYLSVYRAFYGFMVYARLYEEEAHQGRER